MSVTPISNVRELGAMVAAKLPATVTEDHVSELVVTNPVCAVIPIDDVVDTAANVTVVLIEAVGAMPPVHVTVMVDTAAMVADPTVRVNSNC